MEEVTKCVTFVSLVKINFMKTLKVIICKAGKGISAHLPELDCYVIARRTVEELKKIFRKELDFILTVCMRKKSVIG